jgi:hypothetical protein
MTNSEFRMPNVGPPLAARWGRTLLAERQSPCAHAQGYGEALGHGECYARFRQILVAVTLNWVPL